MSLEREGLGELHVAMTTKCHGLRYIFRKQSRESPYLTQIASDDRKRGENACCVYVLSAALIPSPDDGRVGQGWGLETSFNDDYRCRHPKL